MSARISDIGGDIWPFLIIGGESEGQSSMVHGEKERRGGRRERVELPDSLMYEAVLQSAGFN